MNKIQVNIHLNYRIFLGAFKTHKRSPVNASFVWFMFSKIETHTHKKKDQQASVMLFKMCTCTKENKKKL